jgi:hypothetical protein
MVFRYTPCEGDVRFPNRASVISRTRRTDAPAKYISPGGSSTELAPQLEKPAFGKAMKLSPKTQTIVSVSVADVTAESIHRGLV